MSRKNKLRKNGYKFWVRSNSYNVIETAHQFYMMAVIDLIIGKAEYNTDIQIYN